MKYTNKIKIYTIDLNLPEEKRWLEVIKEEKSVARKLAKFAIQDIHDYIHPRIKSPIGLIFQNIYRFGGGLYYKEMNTWAKALKLSISDLTLINCTYELSHIQESFGKFKIFGCTAGVRYFPKLGMVHARNMDWPISNIGPATKIFRFLKEDHEFYSVGLPGKVGVISGMVPYGYSVTINWAPTSLNPSFAFGPSFLLREVLETCKTFDEAVSYLCGTELSSSVFYTVCGTRRNEACIIERTKKAYNIRDISRNIVAQANHFEGKFKRSNDSLDYLEEGDDPEDETALDDSILRSQALKKSLKSLKNVGKISDVRKALNVYPVRNDESHQQMIFNPKNGTIKVWASKK